MPKPRKVGKARKTTKVGKRPALEPTAEPTLPPEPEPEPTPEPASTPTPAPDPAPAPPSAVIVPAEPLPAAVAAVFANEPDGPDPTPKKLWKRGKVSEGTRKPNRPTPKPPYKSTAQYADDPTEPNRCHAARKSDGERCGQKSMRGTAVCRLHGGKSTGGPIKHGGYSRSLMKFLPAYNDGRDNADMLYDLTETLALSHAVLTRSLERAEEADVPEFRTRARALLADAFQLGKENKHAEMASKLRELSRFLDEGIKEDRAIRHVCDAIEAMATRKKESWDIRLKAAHALNERDLELVMARVIDTCIRTVGVKDAQRIAQELSREGF